MKGRELLEKMDMVSPVYVEEADHIPIIRVKRWPKAAVAAACLCLVAWGAWGLSGGPGQSGPGPAPGPVDTANVDGLSAQTRATRPPDASLDVVDSSRGLEPCHGILGLKECWVRRVGPEDAANWWYYVPGGDGTYRLVAESWWNAKCAAPYEVDIDGDGTEELIFNLVYDDGQREVQVVRSRDGKLEDGYFDNEFLCSLWAGHGADGLQSSSYRSWYEPERGFVVEHSGLDADGKEVQTVDMFRDLEHFKFHACSLSIRNEEYYETDKLPEVPTQDTQPSDIASIAPEPCPDTLGFANCVVCLKREPELTHWWYYTCEDGEYRLIAYTFGTGDEPDVYRADLDGDGIDELVCNAEWADGAREVLVYRSRDDVIEQGRIDNQYWQENGLEAAGYSIYDPEQGFIVMANDLKDSGWTVTLQGLEHFVFETFEIQAGDPLFPRPDAPASAG